MATVPTITTIQKTECIGNSLVTLTNNFDNIRNAFTTVNTDLAAINNSLTNLTTFANSISSAQLAKAWVNFNGRTGSGVFRTIRNSYNISNVQLENAGQYLITFANPIGDNLVMSGVISPQPNSLSGPGGGVVNLRDPDPFPTLQSCRIVVRDLLGNVYNPNTVSLVFYNN